MTAKLQCTYPGCTDSRDPRWHNHSSAGAAWQTYHEQARKMLDGAQDEVQATVGLGWALLALVEVLKPQDEVTLEVRPRTPIDIMGEHLTKLQGMRGEVERLMPYTGQGMLLDCKQPVVLTTINWDDIENGVVWCGVAMRTTAEPAHQMVPSTRVYTEESAKHAFCGESADDHNPHRWTVNIGCADEEPRWCRGVDA